MNPLGELLSPRLVVRITTSNGRFEDNLADNSAPPPPAEPITPRAINHAAAEADDADVQ